MILIADSGATKTDWCLTDQKNGNTKNFTTQGINPQIQSQVWISKMLLEEVPATVQKMKLDKIHFYGAGVSAIKQINATEQTLQYIFDCDHIEVCHDLLGAVRASCGSEAGIACILGTGSNSVFYDGKQMIKKSYALGYILGDEGSGAYIGKKLLSDYLYNNLPAPIDDHLKNQLNLDRDSILEKIYKEPNPNRFLASFSAVLSNFRGSKYVEKLLADCFSDFLNRHVLIYDECHQYPVHFIGSIAHYYGDVIANLCEANNLQLGKIIQRPIEHLVKYHLDEHAS